MKLRKLLSFIFIIILSTQVLPIENVNFLMKSNVSFELMEDINENHSSSSSNQLNEHEHNKLMMNFTFWNFVHHNTISTSSITFNEFKMKTIIHPYIEINEIPPNFLS